MKTKKHITPTYLLNPTHPVTIALIGCGGTGSQVLTCLGRISYALQQLGHPGFHVRIYDEDTVSQANIARQLFALNDLGLNKANVLATRINRFFGTCWESVPNHYTKETAQPANISITCVDTVKARLAVSDILTAFGRRYTRGEPYMHPYYWLDFGNQADTGQAILGTVGKLEQPKSKKFKTVAKLPVVTEKFDLSTVDEASTGPSCSLADALNKQNLFINSTLAQLGSDLLWRLFSEGMTGNSGLYLNLKNYNVNAIYL